jgi:glucosamine--fructose-6-phosphate aminotransferase (isomerizing)
MRDFCLKRWLALIRDAASSVVCSIIGLVSSLQAAPLVVKGLRRMEYRGYDSAGVATFDGHRIAVRKGVGKVGEVNSFMSLDSLDGRMAIGHTRWATHGGVTVSNAHPHLSSSGRVAIVHNGIIDNYEALKQSLMREGYSFKSETDSEVIANLLEKSYRETGDARHAIRRSVLRLEGKYAVAAIFDDGTLAGVRNHEPLILGVGKDGYFVASDVMGFANQTDKVIYLENEEFATVSGGVVGVYDFRGNPVAHHLTTIAKEFGDADKGEYVHYTLKEIFDQPSTVLRSAGTGAPELGALAAMIRGAKRVYVTGCGTSYHAGLLGVRLLFEFASIAATPIISSEARFFPAQYGDGTVMLAISQSGETADVLEAVESAKKKGATLVSLVNVKSSSLARESKLVVGLDCGPEVGVAATKSYTAELATFYGLVERLVGGLFSFKLRDVPGAMSEALETESRIRGVAARMKGVSDVYVLGAGLHYYSALEASLKMKELAYIHAEAIPGGELKHGPLALIDDDAYVIMINPQDETYADTFAWTHEVKARGAKIIGLSNKPCDMYDYWVPLPTVSPWLYPLVEVVPLQLLAYHLALERNADPDFPRNLAKSVTVK